MPATSRTSSATTGGGEMRLISHAVGLGAGLFVISGRPPSSLPEFLLAAAVVGLGWFCVGAITVEGLLDELAGQREAKAAAAAPEPPPPAPAPATEPERDEPPWMTAGWHDDFEDLL